MPNKHKICIAPAIFNLQDSFFAKGSHTVARTLRTGKRGQNKTYALKEIKHPQDAVIEKILYDILEVCGVKVPKTYLVFDPQDPSKVSLASKIENGCKELDDYINNHYREVQYCDRLLVQRNFRSLGRRGEIMNVEITAQGRCCRLYKVQGLLEHFAVFLYIGDDAIISNTLVIEKREDDKWILDAIKIDPGEGVMSLKNEMQGDKGKNLAIPSNFYENIHELTLDRPFYVSQCCYPNGVEKTTIQNHPYFIFINRDPNDHIDGIRRVANLSDEQIQSIVYTEMIPEVLFPSEGRNKLYEVLIRRRNHIREVFAAKLNPELETGNQQTVSL